MHTSPFLRAWRQLQAGLISLRGWLIRIGVLTPPGKAARLIDEQRDAQTAMRFRDQPRPPRYPGW